VINYEHFRQTEMWRIFATSEHVRTFVPWDGHTLWMRYGEETVH
jgi:hypothetical protein